MCGGGGEECTLSDGPWLWDDELRARERNWRWKGRGSIVIGEWLLLSMEVMNNVDFLNGYPALYCLS